ncbi:MAG: carbohydrate ABC transporter permease [Chloroflexi bacterium]|nr:carbohydrate ABC transporter permease [Chloroflexota bacterium]
MNRRRINRWLLYIVLTILLVVSLGPMLLILFTSVKSEAEAALQPLLPPKEIILENFKIAWERGQFANTMRVSGLLVIGTVAGQLLLCGMAAYALARLRLPAMNGVMIYLLAASTIPFFMYMVPLFITWRTIHLINTIPGTIILHTAMGIPFTTFLLRSFLVQLPSELEDAARVDGAREWQVFSKVVLPIAWPAFLTAGLLTGIGVWSSYELELIFMSGNSDLLPVMYSFSLFQGRFSRNWPLTSAGAIIAIAPILILYLAMQRRFIEGLTAGGLKA